MNPAANLIRPFARPANDTGGLYDRLREFVASLNPLAPSAEREQKVREVALGWAELEPMMKDPRVARGLKPHYDFWLEFWSNWQRGKKDENVVNQIVIGLNAARADALSMLAHKNMPEPDRSVPQVPDDTLSAARRAAEWIDANAPTLKGISASLNSAFRGVPQWLFSDPDPVAAARLSMDPNWPATESERLRVIRTLAAQTGWIVDAFRKDGIRKLPDGTQVFGSDPRPAFPDPEHNYAASTLARTWMLFLPPGRYKLQDTVTTGGLPAQRVPSASSDTITLGRPSDTGNPIAIAVAAFLARAAFAAACVYIAGMAVSAVDRQLMRGSDTARMMNLHKAAVAVIGDHAQREQSAGRPIPFTDKEMKLLNTLLEAQKIIAGKTEQPLPDPFGGALESLSRGIGKGIEKGGEALDDTAKSLPWLAVAAVVVGGVILLRR